MDEDGPLLLHKQLFANLPTPTINTSYYDGYNYFQFSGWFRDTSFAYNKKVDNGDNVYDFSTTLDTNQITLYAKWTLKTITADIFKTHSSGFNCSLTFTGEEYQALKVTTSTPQNSAEIQIKGEQNLLNSIYLLGYDGIRIFWVKNEQTVSYNNFINVKNKFQKL